jgi:hypothetical protein
MTHRPYNLRLASWLMAVLAAGTAFLSVGGACPMVAPALGQPVAAVAAMACHGSNSGNGDSRGTCEMPCCQRAKGSGANGSHGTTTCAVSSRAALDVISPDSARFVLSPVTVPSPMAPVEFTANVQAAAFTSLYFPPPRAVCGRRPRPRAPPVLI